MKFRPTQAQRDAHPGCALIQITSQGKDVLVVLPNTPENRAKHIGCVPYDMLDGATVYPDLGPSDWPHWIDGAMYMEGRKCSK